MKKIIIAATFVLITGTLSSQVKLNSTPKTNFEIQHITETQHIATDGKELASGD